MQRRCSYFSYKLYSKKWNEIHMEQLAGGKCIEKDWLLRTLKFEMPVSL
jgi:hypothetical protein